jgi:hypothetical protein
MKRTLPCLGALLLTGAGCVPGLYTNKEFEEFRAKQVAPAQRPPVVLAEQINESNAHAKAEALEAEMDFDAQCDITRTPVTAPR